MPSRRHPMSLRSQTGATGGSPRNPSRPTFPALPQQRRVTARLLLLAGIVVAFALAWRHAGSIPLLVVGQPRSVGLLQRDQEVPFFRNLAATTGLPLRITYRSADSFGLKDTHQLEAVRDGLVDIISLRFVQNIEDEPGLEGLDLPGMISSFPQARRVAEAYSPTLDRYLQSTFQAKLLGVWSFGPQVMVCRTPLAGLKDLRGRKVRIASRGLAQLVAALGGTPALIAFDDTKAALDAALVDCAVTSAASAAFAGWTEKSHFYYPLAFQFGFNGYVISLRKWQALSPREQQRLMRAFRSFSGGLWHYSEALQQEAERCIVGGPCQQLPAHRLTMVPATPQDVRMLQNLSRRIVLPSWSARCERIHSGCRAEWERTVLPSLGIAGAPRRQP